LGERGQTSDGQRKRGDAERGEKKVLTQRTGGKIGEQASSRVGRGTKEVLTQAFYFILERRTQPSWCSYSELDQEGLRLATEGGASTFFGECGSDVYLTCSPIRN